MSNGTVTDSCRQTCWIIAAILGVVLAAVLTFVVGSGFLQAVFAGIVGAVILGFLLPRFLCSNENAHSDSDASVMGASGAVNGDATGEGDAAKPEARVTMAPEADEAVASSATPVAVASKAFEMQPSKALAGEAELASRKGDWKYVAPKAEEAGAPKKASPKKPAAGKATDAKADAKPDPAKAKRPAVAADGKPELLKKAREGGADDLKLISGVGPKLEGTLNELGFWHFDQVAGWRKKEVEWVDSRLKFKGRIERDGWIAQAKILAKGGETEFSKRKKK